MAKIILTCSFSNRWWIRRTCFPQCSPWITTSNPLSHFGLGCLRETLSGDKDSEVLYLLCRILSCPLINAMPTTISFCLKFPPLATTLNCLPTSHGSSSGWTMWLHCVTSCWPTSILSPARSRSGVATGVCDEGSHAGDEEIIESGIRVMLPEEIGFWSGLGRWGSW